MAHPVLLSVQVGPSGKVVGWLDLDLRSSQGLWVATIATFSPSSVLEHPKPPSHVTYLSQQMDHLVEALHKRRLRLLNHREF